MTAVRFCAEAEDFLPPEVARDEVDRFLAAALLGSVVEATIRIRALTEVAAATTPQLCAIAAALA